MSATVLLTGRGNNTLKDKNILPIFGKPLLHFPSTAALQAKKTDRFFVSSDCEKILAAAKKLKFEPIVRPSIYSTPDAQHSDVVIHALGEMRDRGHVPDLLVVLLANSPTITAGWVDDCITLLEDDETATAAVPVSIDLDHHPFRAKRLASDGSLKSFFDFKGKSVSTNRQDLPPSYFLCHNFWVLRVECLLQNQKGDPPWDFMGKRVLPYEVEESFDIHDMDDVERAKRWLKQHNLHR